MSRVHASIEWNRVQRRWMLKCLSKNGLVVDGWSLKTGKLWHGFSALSHMILLLQCSCAHCASLCIYIICIRRIASLSSERSITIDHWRHYYILHIAPWICFHEFLTLFVPQLSSFPLMLRSGTLSKYLNIS